MSERLLNLIDHKKNRLAAAFLFVTKELLLWHGGVGRLLG